MNRTCGLYYHVVWQKVGQKLGGKKKKTDYLLLSVVPKTSNCCWHFFRWKKSSRALLCLSLSLSFTLPHKKRRRDKRKWKGWDKKWIVVKRRQKSKDERTKMMIRGNVKKEENKGQERGRKKWRRLKWIMSNKTYVLKTFFVIVYGSWQYTYNWERSFFNCHDMNSSLYSCWSRSLPSLDILASHLLSQSPARVLGRKDRATQSYFFPNSTQGLARREQKKKREREWGSARTLRM